MYLSELSIYVFFNKMHINITYAASNSIAPSSRVNKHSRVLGSKEYCYAKLCYLKKVIMPIMVIINKCKRGRERSVFKVDKQPNRKNNIS